MYAFWGVLRGVEVLESGDARMKEGIAARCVLSPRDHP